MKLDAVPLLTIQTQRCEGHFDAQSLPFRDQLVERVGLTGYSWPFQLLQQNGNGYLIFLSKTPVFLPTRPKNYT